MRATVKRLRRTWGKMHIPGRVEVEGNEKRDTTANRNEIGKWHSWPGKKTAQVTKQKEAKEPRQTNQETEEDLTELTRVLFNIESHIFLERLRVIFSWERCGMKASWTWLQAAGSTYSCNIIKKPLTN